MPTSFYSTVGRWPLFPKPGVRHWDGNNKGPKEDTSLYVEMFWMPQETPLVALRGHLSDRARVTPKPCSSGSYACLYGGEVEINACVYGTNICELLVIIQEMNSYAHQNTSMKLFKAALFVKTKNWQQLKYLSTVEQINIYSYNGIYSNKKGL